MGETIVNARIVRFIFNGTDTHTHTHTHEREESPPEVPPTAEEQMTVADDSINCPVFSQPVLYQRTCPVLVGDRIGFAAGGGR